MISIVQTMNWHRLLNSLSQACTRLISQHLDIPFTLGGISFGPSRISNFHAFNYIPDDFLFITKATSASLFSVLDLVHEL